MEIAQIGDECMVLWLDIVHESEDTDHQKALRLKPVEFTTRGVLLASTHEKVTLASTTFTEDEAPWYREVTCIPRGCVMSVKKIKEAG